jgi:hypothetical protein
VSFSDQDVKRIKKPGVMITDGDIEALLARLEAAEKVIGCLQEMVYGHECGHMEAWRKACGK